MANIPEGCVLFARKTMKSEIWKTKPAWWLKVWTYILMKVNHKGNDKFKRGQNFFNTKEIYHDCKLYLEHIKPKSILNAIDWMRETTQVTTQKTTRGIIITVCNYGFYQDMSNYKNDAPKETPKKNERTGRGKQNDTINNNDNNVKNDSEGLFPNEEIEQKEIPDKPSEPPKKKTNPDVRKFINWWFDKYKQQFGNKYFVSGGKDGKITKALLETYSFDELVELAKDFFNSEDEFVEKAGYTIGVFVGQINKLNKKTKKKDRYLR